MKTDSGLVIPNKKIVYTSIFGDYDELQDPQVVPDDVDFICFTDTPKKRSKVWRFIYEPRLYEDSTRCARKFKILPHRFLPSGYDISVWVDGHHIITGNMSKFIDNLE